MNRPRTYCGICGDSGAVSIWHPKTLSSLRRGDERVRLFESVAACTCRRGDVFAKASAARRNKLDRLGDRDWHCRRTIRGRGTLFNPAADVEEFGNENLRNYVAGNITANYEPSFDDFNQGGSH